MYLLSAQDTNMISRLGYFKIIQGDSNAVEYVLTDSDHLRNVQLVHVRYQKIESDEEVSYKIVGEAKLPWVWIPEHSDFYIWEVLQRPTPQR
jgi:hypothetical protein